MAGENEKDLFGEPVKDADIDMDKANREMIFMDDEHLRDTVNLMRRDGFLAFFYAPLQHVSLTTMHINTPSQGGDGSNKSRKCTAAGHGLQDFGMYTCRDLGIHYTPPCWF